MSTSVELSESTQVWESPPAKPLDEAAWQAWGAKGRAHDKRGRAARMNAVNCVSIAVLLAAAGLSSQLTPYEIVVRFIVVAGAIVVMFQTFHAHHYAVGAILAAFALLYNPVAPILSFSGDWQRALMVASTIPFIVSLGWRNVRLASND
jgi:hypothetical protein